MARNAEKANAMLNRFVAAKKDAARDPAAVEAARARRPWKASECTDVHQAEKWRNSVLREITKEMVEIQNATLGEHRLRELNDHLNKLLREKKAWEAQIKALGGTNYGQNAPRITDTDGRGALGSGNYFYFGAAKDLPGVRELFDKQVVEAAKRQRGELYQKIDADYYGYRDDDDGVLEQLERKQQEKLVAASIRDWKAAHDSADMSDEPSSGAAAGAASASSSSSSSLKAHVELPSQEDIEQMILAKKKAEILAKYASL